MRTHSDGDSPGRASAGLESEWNRFVLPGSQVEKSGGTWRFINLESGGGQYTDAQIDDYQGLSRRRFRWNPPLTMTVRARFSHAADELIGTAGFGFWNDPFLMTGFRPPALPRAIWFFYSSAHSNIKLAREAPGWGWKAATIDAVTLPFFLLAPTAPLTVPLMNVPPLYRWLWSGSVRSKSQSRRLGWRWLNGIDMNWCGARPTPRSALTASPSWRVILLPVARLVL